MNHSTNNYMHIKHYICVCCQDTTSNPYYNGWTLWNPEYGNWYCTSCYEPNMCTAMDKTNINMFDVKCEECEARTMHYECYNCSAYVCRNKKCSMIFPHYENTNIAICKTCENDISTKLQQVPYVEDDLILLKKKIAEKKSENYLN